MQILIDSGKNQGIVDLHNQRYPRWLGFMKGWDATTIKDYCQKKQWKYTVLETAESKDSYFLSGDPDLHDWD
jgi:hypothetical protein